MKDHSEVGSKTSGLNLSRAIKTVFNSGPTLDTLNLVVGGNSFFEVPSVVVK